MKKLPWQWIGAFLLAIVLPWLLLRLTEVKQDHKTPENSATVSESEAQHSFEEQEILLLIGDAKQTLSMEDYLTGVLLCEIPGTFHMEAKMAQAVVARTYVLRVMSAGVKHDEGAICAQPGCCQGFTDPKTFEDAQTVQQARQAVRDTAGEVLTYNGNLIDATYFSCSGGKTEAAVAVWGADVPYLQSVESPGEESAAYFTDSVTFTSDQFQDALGLSLSGRPSSWLGSVTYTEGGGVDTMYIGGAPYNGTTLRNLLGLRSTAFTMTAIGNSIVVTTRGYGHRVGMSQYGAQAMAQAGSTYDLILQHYYQGTVLQIWTNGDI